MSAAPRSAASARRQSRACTPRRAEPAALRRERVRRSRRRRAGIRAAAARLAAHGDPSTKSSAAVVVRDECRIVETGELAPWIEACQSLMHPGDPGLPLRERGRRTSSTPNSSHSPPSAVNFRLSIAAAAYWEIPREVLHREETCVKVDPRKHRRLHAGRQRDARRKRRARGAKGQRRRARSGSCAA